MLRAHVHRQKMPTAARYGRWTSQGATCPGLQSWSAQTSHTCPAQTVLSLHSQPATHQAKSVKRLSADTAKHTTSVKCVATLHMPWAARAYQMLYAPVSGCVSVVPAAMRSLGPGRSVYSTSLSFARYVSDSAWPTCNNTCAESKYLFMYELAYVVQQAGSSESRKASDRHGLKISWRLQCAHSRELTAARRVPSRLGS